MYIVLEIDTKFAQEALFAATAHFAGSSIYIVQASATGPFRVEVPLHG
jgi:hypothetical protein